MIRLPNGEKLWIPGRILAGMGAHVPLARMRLVQEATDRLVLYYVPLPGAGAVDAAGLEAYGRAHIHPEVMLTARAVDDLPRSEGGKYEDVVGLG